MPYSFNMVEQALGGPANIFGDSQQPAFEPVKAPSFSGGSSSSGQVQRPRSSTERPTAAAFSSALTGLQSGAGAATGRVKNEIAQANNALQEKANAYGQKAEQTAAGYRVSDDDLKGVESGDAKATEAVRNRLTQAQPTFESFQGLSEKELESVDASKQYLNSPGAYGNLLSDQAGPGYSSGRRNLESILLGQDADFQAARPTLLSDQDALLQANSQEKALERTEAANKMLTDRYASETKSAKDRLGANAQAIKSGAQAEADAELAKRGAGDGRQALYDEFLKKLQAERAPEAWALALNPNVVLDDLSPYIKANGVTPGMYFDQGEVDRYGRIMDILGNPDTIGSDPMTPQYSVDEAALRAAILEAAATKSFPGMVTDYKLPPIEALGSRPIAPKADPRSLVDNVLRDYRNPNPYGR